MSKQTPSEQDAIARFTFQERDAVNRFHEGEPLTVEDLKILRGLYCTVRLSLYVVGITGLDRLHDLFDRLITFTRDNRELHLALHDLREDAGGFKTLEHARQEERKACIEVIKSIASRVSGKENYDWLDAEAVGLLNRAIKQIQARGESREPLPPYQAEEAWLAQRQELIKVRGQAREMWLLLGEIYRDAIASEVNADEIRLTRPIWERIIAYFEGNASQPPTS